MGLPRAAPAQEDSQTAGCLPSAAPAPVHFGAADRSSYPAGREQRSCSGKPPWNQEPDRTDARESWSHGGHGWRGNASSRNSSSHWGRSGPTRQLDRKDIDKPEKFSGDTSTWVNWAASFKRYLRRYEELWLEILEKIEAKKCQAITKEFEAELEEEYYWKDIRLLEEQLYCALEV